MSGSQSGLSGLRIVQVTALGITAQSFLVGHFKKLKEAGAGVTLVASDDAEARRASSTAGIHFEPVSIRPDFTPFRDVISVWRLWRLFRRLRPNVVHAHMSKGALLAILAGRLAGVPVRIYHNHGLALLCAHGIKRRILRMTEWMTNRLATHSLFISPSTRRAAIDAGVATADRSQVLGAGSISGVDVAKFAPDADAAARSNQRRIWGIADDTVIVGYVGRLLVEKGIEALIEAWRSLDPAVRSHACLVLVGGNVLSEPAMQRLVDGAAKETMSVKSIDWTENLTSCYSAMDVLVLPSWREGFGNCIIEAQSMAIPVITTTASGCIDAVQHDVTGLQVPVNDAAALADAMSRLIRSAEERSRLGKQGRQRMLDEFAEDKVLENMLTFYRQQIAPVFKSSARD